MCVRAHACVSHAQGDVHFEAWPQPTGERFVLTRPKILCVKIEWKAVIPAGENTLKRYVMRAATYEQLRDAV